MENLQIEGHEDAFITAVWHPNELVFKRHAENGTCPVQSLILNAVTSTVNAQW